MGRRGSKIPGAYSTLPHRDLDGRTYLGKLHKTTIRELTAHVGGKPNPAQRALIERIASYKVRLALLDREALAGAASETDARWYSHWSAGMARALVALGVEAPKLAPQEKAPPTQTLAQYLASKRAPSP